MAVDLRVVMPVHDAGDFLRTSLASVLADLPPRSEVVVVDDGSSDSSGAVLAEMAGQDERVTVVRNELPTGVSAALNTAIRHGACPDFVAVAEHDDVVLPGRFAAQLDYLRGHPDCGAVSSTGRYVGPTGRVFGRVAVGPRSDEELAEMVARSAPILVSHPAVMYRRAALDAVGLYDSAFDGAQDLEIICRLVYAGRWKVRRLPEIHFHYRLHDSATSFAKASFQRDVTRYIAYRNAKSRDGDRYLTYPQWKAEFPLSRWHRFQAARRDWGALLYRRAGLSWVSGRPVRCGLLFLGAAVVHPRWVRYKLRVLAGRA